MLFIIATLWEIPNHVKVVSIHYEFELKWASLTQHKINAQGLTGLKNGKILSCLAFWKDKFKLFSKKNLSLLAFWLFGRTML